LYLEALEVEEAGGGRPEEGTAAAWGAARGCCRLRN
jgi:hypothetical protein